MKEGPVPITYLLIYIDTPIKRLSSLQDMHEKNMRVKRMLQHSQIKTLKNNTTKD